MIVYLARDIPAFVMYCVNGESGSSLLIEPTHTMITIIINFYYALIIIMVARAHYSACHVLY